MCDDCFIVILFFFFLRARSKIFLKNLHTRTHTRVPTRPIFRVPFRRRSHYFGITCVYCGATLTDWRGDQHWTGCAVGAPGWKEKRIVIINTQHLYTSVVQPRSEDATGRVRINLKHACTLFAPASEWLRSCRVMCGVQNTMTNYYIYIHI